MVARQWFGTNLKTDKQQNKFFPTKLDGRSCITLSWRFYIDESWEQRPRTPRWWSKECCRACVKEVGGFYGD